MTTEQELRASLLACRQEHRKTARLAKVALDRAQAGHDVTGMLETLLAVAENAANPMQAVIRELARE